MDELISVIVPVYNVEKYLRECIDSIIRQTYKNIEIILIDDGSKDSSGQICDEYTKKDKRIKVIHQENRGVSSSRNLGIKKSNGKWITFVDSDDWLEDNFIEVLFNIAKRENADISISGYNRVQNSKIEKINISTEIQEYNSYEYLIKTLNPQTGLGFCHMRLIRKAVINNIQFDENLPVAEDALFNMQISTKINKAIHSNKNLYNYRNNSESVVKKYNEKYAQKYLEAMEAIKKYLEDNKIQTRMLFGGNIINQPCFNEMRNNKEGYRVIGNLENTETVMNNSFWIGVYSGMEKKMLNYMINRIREFFNLM